MHSAAQAGHAPEKQCTFDAPLKPLFTSPAEHSMPMYLQASKHLCERAGMQPCTHPRPTAGRGTPSAHCNMQPPQVLQTHFRHLHTRLPHAW